ncbi:hypothetical protein AAHZ94_01945 [Streptomyces sp. HSW2009]|uniref:hypothetical protein n=1 Tax=Streptomyces sp. HSW2009 TaxID=3142890 RepID=UPI0032EAFA8D
MQGPAPHDSQHIAEAPRVRAALDPGAVDALLGDLRSAALALVAEAEAEEQREAELHGVDEELVVAQQAEGRSVYEPSAALASARSGLAARSARRHQQTARAFVAWWADAATVALVTAACQASPHEFRITAANPEVAMDEEGLAHLPPVSDRSRQLIELGAHMHDNGDGLREMVTDLAVRTGVRIGRDAYGQVTVYEDGMPEARRHRLWGDCWADHQVPALPTAEQLGILLMDAPGDVLVRLHAALDAIDATLVAKTRTERLADKSDPWTPDEMIEYETLCAEVSGLTRRLAEYAQVAMDSVPAVRTTARQRGERAERADGAGGGARALARTRTESGAGVAAARTPTESGAGASAGAGAVVGAVGMEQRVE